MRILTVATRLAGIGGLERAQLNACRLLRAHGHRIDLLYTESGDLEPAWEAIADRRVRVGGYTLSRREPVASVADLVRVHSAIRRLAPDAIYVHHHRHTPAVALAGTPTVCHLHLPPPPERSRQEMLGLSRVQSFVAVSEFTARQWRERLGADPERFTVVPNGVDVGEFTPADEAARRAVREELGIPPDAFFILYAGRVDPEKGLDVAIEAMRVLAGEPIHLAIVGDPNPGSFGGDDAAAAAYGAELRSHSAALPISWHGRLPDVSRVLAAADLVVLPSRFPDPFPLIVLETLASATPIVASNVGGIPEVLGERFPECLVPSGDPHALAVRIRELAGWRARVPGLGQAGRELIAERFTLTHMGARLSDAFAFSPHPTSDTHRHHPTEAR